MDKQTAKPRYEKALKLVGVGYRVRWGDSKERVTPKASSGRDLVFDVGKSHVETFKLPVEIGATIDTTGTKLQRRYLPSVTTGDVLGDRRAKQSLGNTAYRIMQLRPRSPYTGNGILEEGVTYPKLKSTKTKAKK